MNIVDLFIRRCHQGQEYFRFELTLVALIMLFSHQGRSHHSACPKINVKHLVVLEVTASESVCCGVVVAA